MKRKDIKKLIDKLEKFNFYPRFFEGTEEVTKARSLKSCKSDISSIIKLWNEWKEDVKFWSFNEYREEGLDITMKFKSCLKKAVKISNYAKINWPLEFEEDVELMSEFQKIIDREPSIDFLCSNGTLTTTDLVDSKELLIKEKRGWRASDLSFLLMERILFKSEISTTKRDFRQTKVVREFIERIVSTFNEKDLELVKDYSTVKEFEEGGYSKDLVKDLPIVYVKYLLKKYYEESERN